MKELRYTRVKDKNGEIHLAAFEKEETVFFLDELFPELKGKTLIDFVHMVNGDPQKAAQMDRYIEWKSRRICIWIFPGDWERFSIFI